MLRLVDLSLDIYDKAPTFWPDPKTAILPHLAVANMNYNITQIIMSSHLGTHADAPFHFFDDGLTIEQVDVRRGFGPAEVLDLRHKAPTSYITPDDLEAFGDRIKRGSRLILWTDWDKQFPAPHYFSDQPRLAVETCVWIAEHGVRCVAMDLPTTNPPEYTPTHHALLNAQAQVLIVEGLRGLGRLQSERVILMALPLRLRGRDGAQCRAMAIDGDVGPLCEVLDALEYDANY